jgi:hypothetical protein
MATDTMFEFMGVRVDPVDQPVAGELRKLTGPVPSVGKVAQNGIGYTFEGRLNDSFKVLNLLFDKGVAVRRIDKAAPGLRPGDFVVAPGSEAVLTGVAKETGVDFKALSAPVTAGAHDLKRQRVAMYQRYGGGNIDEGWTRWLIEQFGFPYTSLMDAEIKKGSLNQKYDVIILPDDSTATITGEPAAAGAGGRGGRGAAADGAPSAPGEGRGGRGPTPPEYRTGIGADGVTALKDFVQKGGTLVTLNGAASFAMERLAVGVRNVVAGKTTKEFWCPGSTLKVEFDNTNRLAYGMPAEGLAVYLNSPAFEVTAQNADQYETIVRYASRDLLESGWLVGEDTLARKAAMVAAKLGEGRVVLIGFPAQHRAQTHGTFKLLFNALVR